MRQRVMSPVASRACGRASPASIRIASAACCFAALSAPLWSSLTPTTLFVGRPWTPRSYPRRRPWFHPHAAMSSAGKSAESKDEVLFGGGDGIVVPAPSGAADSVVVFLHGLGDTAHGWASAFPLRGLPNTKYVLPTADTVPVTLNGGYRMPSWFDLYGLDQTAPDDEAGIARAGDRLDSIVETQVAMGIPRSRIVVGGFSQGGAVALSYGLKTKEKLAGLLGMSSWLPKSTWKAKAGPGIRETKVLMCHGDSDTVIAMMFGSASAQALRSLSADVSFKVYPGLEHSANPDELADVERFVSSCLS